LLSPLSLPFHHLHLARQIFELNKISLLASFPAAFVASQTALISLPGAESQHPAKTARVPLVVDAEREYPIFFVVIEINRLVG